MRSDVVKRHMKIHIVHTVGDQSENNEQMCKGIVNDIVGKMFMQDNSKLEKTHGEEHDLSTLKRKHCEDENCTKAKRNNAQDHTDIKRKYEIDYDDLKKKMKKKRMNMIVN